MRDLAALVALAIVLLAAIGACGPKPRSRDPFVADVGGVTTGSSSTWSAPAWVTHPPDETLRIVSEIDTAAALWGERELVVRVLPGQWTVGESRVAGQCLDRNTVLVAYGEDRDPRLLAALPHEVLHAHFWRTTGDPDASHASPLWATLPPGGGQ